VDKQGNTVWHRYYGSSSFSESYLDAALLGDSALVAGGVQTVQATQAFTTIIDRISLEDGNLLQCWQSSLNPDIGWFGGMGELSSGNIVAGGFASQGALLYGWLLKIDPQGCLEGEPCELPTSAGEAPPPLGLAGRRAFPNPTSGHLSVELPEGYPAAWRGENLWANPARSSLPVHPVE
jgi:hypothetical protein